MPDDRIEAQHFSPDTREFIQLLHRHGVRYLIVGGEAVIYHGHVRLTGDVDFFYATDPANATALYEALLDFWDGDVPGIEHAGELEDPDLVLQFGRPPNRIDLLSRISGVAFEEAWVSRLSLALDEGTPIHYISLDHLIANKRASGRPKDLDDLAYLHRAAGADDAPAA